MTSIPKLDRKGHQSHCIFCLTGLPFSQVEVDPSRYVSHCILLQPLYLRRMRNRPDIIEDRSLVLGHIQPTVPAKRSSHVA